MMIADLTRTLIHGRPSPVARDDVFAAELAKRYGGTWDVWADHSSPGRVRVHIAGPGGTVAVYGTWFDAFDVNKWELRQLNAAKEIS